MGGSSTRVGCGGDMGTATAGLDCARIRCLRCGACAGGIPPEAPTIIPAEDGGDPPEVVRARARC